MTITISEADAAAFLAGTPISIQLAISPVVPPVTPPVIPPAAMGQYVIYQSGVYAWPGDYNNGAISNYKYAASDGVCLQLTATAPWSEWLPYSHANPGPFLDISKCCGGGQATKLQFSLKATQPNAQFSLYCVSAGDLQPPPSIPGYVSAPGVFPVGVWVTQTVELSSLGLGPGQTFSGNQLYKLGMQSKSGLASEIWYVNNVLLLP
jgi:hypothetical protein